MKNVLGLLTIISMLTLVSCKKKDGGASTEDRTGKTELKLELPKAEFMGTPKPIKIGVDYVKDGQYPAVWVPEGTTLLSKGKPVTSSDSPFIGTLDLITDGEKNAPDGYYVELTNEPQHVQIDLEKTHEINAIALWHFHLQKRVYNDVIIQVSDDAEFKTGVTTVFNNDFDDSSEMGKGSDTPYVETNKGWLVNAKGAKGRYVRLYSNGNNANDMSHYIEVEVYGK